MSRLYCFENVRSWLQNPGTNDRARYNRGLACGGFGLGSFIGADDVDVDFWRAEFVPNWVGTSASPDLLLDLQTV